MLRLMLRVGVRESLAPDGRIRTVLVAVATALLACALCAVVLVVARQQGMAARASDMAPVPAARGETVVAEWSSLPFDLVDGQPVTVIALRPAGPAPQPPPGLTRFPEPGEAIVSPTLRSSLLEVDPGRYGRIVDTIGAGALITPTDRVVYLNTRSVPEDAWTGVTAWGELSMGRFAAMLYRPPVLLVVQVILFWWALPAVTGLAGAARMGSAGRRARLRLADRVGAPVRWTGTLGVLDVAVGATLGALAALLLVGVLCVADLPLPWLETVLAAADARARAPWLVAAVLLSWVCALAAGSTAALHVPWRAGRRRHGRAWLALIPTGLLLCLLGVNVLPPGPGQPLFNGGIACVAVGTPSLVAVLVGRLGRAMARDGWRRGGAASLVSGRRLVARSREQVRLVSVIIIGIIALSQAAGWVGLLSDQHREALATRAALGIPLLMSDVTDAPQAQRFVDLLPDGVAPLLAAPSLADGEPSRLTGDCRALEHLRLPCTPARYDDAHPAPPGPGRVLVTLFGPDVVVEPRAVDLSQTGEGTQLLLVGRTLDAASLQRLAYQHAPTQVMLTPWGEDWVAVGHMQQIKAGWIGAFGALGLASLLVGLFGAVLAESEHGAKGLAPVAALFENRRLHAAIAATGVLLPMTAATASGVLLAYGFGSWLAHADDRWRISWATLGGSAAVSLVAALFGAALAAAQSRRAALDWRPGADNRLQETTGPATPPAPARRVRRR